MCFNSAYNDCNILILHLLFQLEGLIIHIINHQINQCAFPSGLQRVVRINNKYHQNREPGNDSGTSGGCCHKNEDYLVALGLDPPHVV